MEKKTIGAFIAALRKASGLTQKQLADKLCVSDKAVSRWERDETLPDLTLIPVIAEIFGVTSDELLRGQRASLGAPPTDFTAEKTKMQLQRYLTSAKTRFKIQSIISVGIAFIGFISAMICNFAFLRARLGFLLGSVFIAASLICQVIFTILANSSMGAEELATDTLEEFRKFILRTNEIVISGIAVFLSATLPLIIHVPDAYWGLPAYTYASLMVLYLVASGALCALICWIVNIKLGYSSLSRKAKMRLLAAAILIPIMGLTWVGHYFSTEWIYSYRYLLAEHTTYDNFPAFLDAIETPLDVDGTPLTLYETYYNIMIYKNKAGEEIAAPRYVVYNGSVPNVEEYSYWHANKTIADYCNHENHFYTLSPEQASIASRNYQIICIALFILYPVEIAAAAVICHRKEKGS